jgi:hypothetical protein
MATIAAASVVSAREGARTAAIPWSVHDVRFASTSIDVGVIRGISWRMAIGRDAFRTPEHRAMYAGGIVGGTASGDVVLRTTFGGREAERDGAVRFRGFRGPIGARATIRSAFAGEVPTAAYDAVVEPDRTR